MSDDTTSRGDGNPDDTLRDVALRDYQLKFVDDIRVAFRGHRQVLGVSPTGSGKTVAFAYITKRASERGKRIMLVAHRTEICDQISEALDTLGVRHGRIQPGHTMTDDLTQIAMINTLSRRAAKVAVPDLLVIDEAHHCAAQTYDAVCKLYPNTLQLGVTATPRRLDGKGLGRSFTAMVQGPGTQALIDAGWLASYTYLAPPTQLDLSHVHTTAGDYTIDELAAAVDNVTITGDAVEHYRQHIFPRPALVFCVRVDHAEHVAARFAAAGYRAASVDGKLDRTTRRERIEGIGNGQLQVLTSCALISEGLDVPSVGGVILLRPTKSLALHLQQCLDAQTQVLTQRGWVGHDQISKTDTVCAWNENTEIIEWCKVDGIISRSLDDRERMFGILSPHLDIRVTGGHDMLVRCRSKTSKNWRKERATSLACRRHMFVVPVAATEDTPGAPLTDDEIRFLGWFLTDGTKNKKHHQITISQSASKQEHCDEIRRVLTACGLKFGEHRVVRRDKTEGYPDLIQFYLSKGPPRVNRKHLRGWGGGILETFCDKSIPAAYDGLNQRQVGLLLSAMNMGDGANAEAPSWKRGTMAITFGDNEEMADRVQSLCVRRGFRANKASYHYPGRSKWFSLHIKECQTATIAGVGDKDGVVQGRSPYRRSRFTELPSIPNETVWCVQNRLGTLVVRRNGKVTIVGNCGRSLRPKPDGARAIILDHVGNVTRHGLPDCPREWTLEDTKVANTAQIVTCRECDRVFQSGPKWQDRYDCAQGMPEGCALAPRVGDGSGGLQAPVERAGSLVQYNMSPEWAHGCDIIRARGPEFRTLLAHADTHAKLEEIRIARGYKYGWSRVMLNLRHRKKGGNHDNHQQPQNRLDQ